MALDEQQKIGIQTSLVASLVLHKVNDLPAKLVTTYARYIGTLSAASTLAVEWIKAIDDPKDRQKMGVALASRLLDVADVLIAVGNGIELAEAFKMVGQPVQPEEPPKDPNGNGNV